MLNENDFRTLMYCPKYYEFNSKNKLSIESAILNKLHARTTSLYLKNRKIDLVQIYNSLINVFSKEDTSTLLPADKTNLLNRMNIAMNQSAKHFDFEKFIPISGPIKVNHRLKNHTFTFTINGIYRNIKTKTLHFVEFSDYTEHSIKNDPTFKIKLNKIKDLVPSHHTGRARAYLHVFYFKSDFLEEIILSSENLKIPDYSAISDILSNKSFYPILPCNRSCKYKKRCV